MSHYEHLQVRASRASSRHCMSDTVERIGIRLVIRNQPPEAPRGYVWTEEFLWRDEVEALGEFAKRNPDANRQWVIEVQPIMGRVAAW